ncbi:TraB/GumN family protein [Oryzomonas sagensis]|uniref:TraB/GumN family protein n=1 Tax=Oryzomonas sagensis TaxID=2603857 RepID=A0ABQ6TNU3_9BACT|nr:TraB/GumN family protein [Oryzomonas sagensis]KAB0670304.1 TraB/GumN family protein [Oryzomonas sagensis]
MKRVIAGIMLVLFACTGAGAESSVWKARKGGSVLYLGGTCHVLREQDFPLPAEFDRAYLAAQVVVFETDLGKLQAPATQQRFLAKAMYGDGSTVDKHLSPKAYAALSAFSEANGIPLSTFGRFKPSMIVTTLTLMELLKMGVTQQGVDNVYYARAIADKKAVDGLETADQQIDYVVSMADGNEDDFVDYSIADMKNIREQFGLLVGAWRTGDAGTLDELMSGEFKARQPQLYKRLIVERNKNWLPVIEGYQKLRQTRFVLVGVAHLVGPDGIIEALRQKGYTVEKL